MMSRTFRTPRRAASRVALTFLVPFAVAGCLEREGRPVNPCTQSAVGQEIQVESVDRVDVLFVVDNSNSMRDEQNTLAREFPLLVNTLATGDFNRDGDNEDPEDFRPVRDLNVGVISTDMGTGGFGGIGGCTMADIGDDGILQNTGAEDDPTCVGRTFERFLNFVPEEADEGDATQFANDFSCIARLGVGGCGFEQQLEAVLKATSPANPTAWTAPGYVAPRFLFTQGQADGPNEGFIRENSVLALVVVTDEDDCSAANPDLYNGASGLPGSPEERCTLEANQDELHPIDRYVDGLLQLRQSPGQLIYAPIVGVPRDLVPRPEDDSVNFSRILNDSRMQIRQSDGDNPIEFSCMQRGVSEAFPPRRIARVGEGLQAAGANVTIQSICNPDFSGTLDAIIRLIADALSQACLPRPLGVNADGTVDCSVSVELPAATGLGCEDVPGWDGVPGEAVGDDALVCRVTQLVPAPEERAAGREPTGEGWFYDDYTITGSDNCAVAGEAFQRIAFTNPPPGGATVQLECLQAVVGGSDVGEFCVPEAADDTCAAGFAPDQTTPLACDDVDRVCGVECADDSDCRDSGLVGFVCDARPKCVANPEDFTCGTASGDASRLFCVNPTCEVN
ncbi:MAG: hypothetical protein ACFCGT_23365 [Sandaracinaceae bacterium]